MMIPIIKAKPRELVKVPKLMACQIWCPMDIPRVQQCPATTSITASIDKKVQVADHSFQSETMQMDKKAKSVIRVDTKNAKKKVGTKAPPNSPVDDLGAAKAGPIWTLTEEDLYSAFSFDENYDSVPMSSEDPRRSC